mmetsp:Transcript_4072/g.9559  ORF Transcript_4072/g.9559 Transcript_4072/m.9559 type:complete len:200 (+) Transcript_4072:893-1492(+)
MGEPRRHLRPEEDHLPRRSPRPGQRHLFQLVDGYFRHGLAAGAGAANPDGNGGAPPHRLAGGDCRHRVQRHRPFHVCVCTRVLRPGCCGDVEIWGGRRESRDADCRRECAVRRNVGAAREPGTLGSQRRIRGVRLAVLGGGVLLHDQFYICHHRGFLRKSCREDRRASHRARHHQGCYRGPAIPVASACAPMATSNEDH